MEPSLNSWTTLFLLAAGQGIFLVFVLLIANTRSKNFNWPIVILMTFFSVTLVNYVLFWSGYIQQFPYLRFIPEIGFYLFGPLLYLYLRRILLQKKASVKFIWHLLPASYILFLGIWYWSFGQFPAKISEFPTLGLVMRFPYLPWTIIAHMLIYNAALLSLIQLHKEDTQDELAAIRIRWSQTITAFFTAFIVAYTSYYVLVQFDFFKIEWDYMISIVMSLAIYGIGYMAFTQPKIFNGIFLQQVFVPKKYKSSQLTDSLAEELFEQINQYFKDELPFLNPELRQAHVCEKLGCSTHNFSQVINEKTGGTFNAFLKEHRLMYAENILKTNPMADIKTVFYQSGFNNKTTFNAAFKSKFSCTPTEYKDRLIALRK